MQTLNIFIFFASVIIPGYLIVSIFFKKILSPLFKVALAYGVGTFFVTIQIFSYLFLAKQDFSFRWFSLIIIIESLVLADLYFKQKHTFGFHQAVETLKSLAGKSNARNIILLSLIILQVGFVLLSSYSRPTATSDSVAMWTYKAKMIFYENTPELSDINSSSHVYNHPHANYPWHIPLLQFWLAKNLKSFDDASVNFIFSAYYIATLIILFYFLRRFIATQISLILVLFLSSMPLFFYHGSNAYVDLVMSYYVLSAFGLLILFFKKLELKYLLFAATFLSISIFTKTEGILFMITSIIILFKYLPSYNSRISIISKYAGTALLVGLPWELFRYKYNLGVMNEGSNISFHPEILSNVLTSLFETASFNIWYYIFFAVFFANLQSIFKRKFLSLTWLLIALPSAAFLLIYVYTDAHQSALNFTAIIRNILILTPLSVLIVGITLSSSRFDRAPVQKIFSPK